MGEAGSKIKSATGLGGDGEAIEKEFMHGVMYVTVHEAKNLPDTDQGVGDRSDPYVVVSVDGDYKLCKTSTVNNNVNPRWEERFHQEVAQPCSFIRVKVKDQDDISRDDHIGVNDIDVRKLITEEPFNEWVELMEYKTGKPNGGSVHIEMEYKSSNTLRRIVEVPDTYFPLRSTGDVTLYQDAHIPEDENPLFKQIQLASGEYTPACAFKDMYEAIRGAQKFIYITGWSVYTELTLMRGEDDEQITLGELLKEKAEDGLTVLVMVWDEKLSTEVTAGLMGTHDEDTAKYFADTKVKAALVPRRREGTITGQLVSTCYTHHQKTIIVDADGSGDKRRLVAFVGGLDLTNGRWDTPNHDLFGSLQTKHKADFYQGCAAVRHETGPREPWHDIHSRVQGRIAYDVLQNFTERWHRQVAAHVNMLVNIFEDEYDLDDVGGAAEEDQWSIQLFRSINKESATFSLNPLRSLGLTGKKKRPCDDSIHRAYTHHIRRAKDFLYIENQYFQGGCKFWKIPETNATHLVPIEILAKIVEKIRTGERFVAYIVVPMYPEGDPASGAVQEMLHWQKNTMEMMYTKIAKELKAAGSEDKPTDYLSFYCLGNREETLPDGLASPKPDSAEETLHNTKRFMVYVHSKMLISDDEYIIVGSANINQRSMSGNRDSEIAIGAQQNEYTIQKVGGLPKGKVHGFRMSLWAEHLACVEDVFQEPASLDCVRRVNELAQENWEKFVSEESCNMDGHLMKYPIVITDDGSIESLPECVNIPDTEAPILGKRSSFIPHKLTT